jgi:hypothetical protein
MVEPGLIGPQGWKQILSKKRDLLSQYDVAKVKADSHPVAVYHGRKAEASIREWLGDFLPKRFAVCSGYVVSHIWNDLVKLRHFDVIIYDQLQSPVLWTEDESNTHGVSSVRAIPAEYVYAVFEVKSVLNATSAGEAIKKLEELRLLLEPPPGASDLYPPELPSNFCCGVIFFEAKSLTHDASITVMGRLIPKSPLRGYIGGVVLRGEGLDVDYTGRLHLGRQSGYDWPPRFGPTPWDTLTVGTLASNPVQYANKEYVVARLRWGFEIFSWFAFDLVARLNDLPRRQYTSLFDGLDYDEPIDQRRLDRKNARSSL